MQIQVSGSSTSIAAPPGSPSQAPISTSRSEASSSISSRPDAGTGSESLPTGSTPTSKPESITPPVSTINASAPSPSSNTTMSSSSSSTSTRKPAPNAADDEPVPSTAEPTSSSSPTTRPTTAAAPTSSQPTTKSTSTSTSKTSSPTPPPVATIPRPTSTVTSVVVTTNSQGTKSTTVTLLVESTLKTPVSLTVTGNGRVITTVPPYLTVYSTRTEANGSMATETHIVANPPDFSSLDGGTNRGLLSNAGAAAGIFTTVGVVVTALGFIAFLMWRRRRQTNLRQRWIAGMRHQRPDSFGGNTFEPDSHHPGSDIGSQRALRPPPIPGLGDSEDEFRLPWDESRRIPAQRAEMRERGFGAETSIGLAGVGSGAHHGRGSTGQEGNIAQGGPIRANFMQEANSGSVNKNMFPPGILGLYRSGSASTTSSANSNAQHTKPTHSPLGRSLSASVNKNNIGNPVPIPSPIRKPAIYKEENPFADRLALSPITERTSIAPTVSSGYNPPADPTSPSMPAPNWVHRQHMQQAHSPTPSTPSMYPPTLPADDELNDTEGFESDATLEGVIQNQGKTSNAWRSNDDGQLAALSEVEANSAFQNLFVSPSRPKAPPPPPPTTARVPPQPLSINTAVNTFGAKATTPTVTVPPRPPRSILRTSSGSLTFSPKITQAQSTSEFIPLTPPASTPGHSPNSSYAWPNSNRSRSGSLPKTQVLPPSTLGQQFSPTISPVVPSPQDKAQEILTNRRMLLDVRRRSAESNSS